MKTMMIKDLSINEKLDHKAMAAVRGGIAVEITKWEELYKKAQKVFPALPEIPSLPDVNPMPPIWRQPDPRLL